MTRQVDKNKIEKALRDILVAIGEDPNREGLRDTPARVARMYAEIFSHGEQDPRQALGATFKEDHHEVVLVKDIPEALEPGKAFVRKILDGMAEKKRLKEPVDEIMARLTAVSEYTAAFREMDIVIEAVFEEMLKSLGLIK